MILLDMGILDDATIEDLVSYKSGLEESIFEYKKLQNLCSDIRTTIDSNNYLDHYVDLKESLRDIYENLDFNFKFLYKKLTLKFFVKNYDLFTTMTQDFALVRECSCEEGIDQLDEKLMSIGSEIFTVLPKPEDDLNYQKQKKIDQFKRESIYNQFEKKYKIKFTQRDNEK